MGLFGNSEELQPKTGKLWQKPQTSLPNKGQERSFIGAGAWQNCYKQKSSWSKLGVQSIVASRWLTCDSTLFAGLLAGEEETFPPSTGIVKYYLMQDPSLPVIFAIGKKW